MLGLIGGGYWGKNLIRTFNSLDVLKTICEINDEIIEKYEVDYPNLTITKYFDDMLNDDEITMICVSLPAQMHYEFGIKVLQAGKHLYVEKPITLNVLEAEKLNLYAKEHNLICMVGHLLHYHPAIATIKEILTSNVLGPIKHITSNRKSHGIYRTYENVLWSFAPHDISIALSLCNGTHDDVQNLSCNGTTYVSKGVHDIVNMSMTINDIYVNINVDWNSPYKEQRLSIACENGLILFDDVEKFDKLKIINNHVQMNNDIPVANKTESRVQEVDYSISPLTHECVHFINCCTTNVQPITCSEEGINVLKVMLQADKLLMSHDKTIQPFTKHVTSDVDNDVSIGNNTKIWRWCHIGKGAIIGDNCSVGQCCFIAGTIGNGCKLQNNVSIYKGVKAGNNVFFGPSCVLTNDINPRCEYSKNGQYMETIIEDGVTIGANATIICGHTIGKYALIGAGAVITKDVEPYSIMAGNPAIRIGTIDECGNRILDSISL